MSMNDSGGVLTTWLQGEDWSNTYRDQAARMGPHGHWTAPSTLPDDGSWTSPWLDDNGTAVVLGTGSEDGSIILTTQSSGTPWSSPVTVASHSSILSFRGRNTDAALLTNDLDDQTPEPGADLVARLLGSASTDSRH
ncbi:hypothetical protein ACT8ZV_06815 [Nocardioides sp. MAHUQ-72]|uniref:hypothetical protein n=1 Tax=unclassified Nocardioides TaxID=2615069 RepID=UPI0036121D50